MCEGREGGGGVSSGCAFGRRARMLIACVYRAGRVAGRVHGVVDARLDPVVGLG